jgi:membrane protein implicated in regulation of membrane protease activity
MIALAVAAPAAFTLAGAWPLVLAAWLILAGSMLTLVQRLRDTRDALEASPMDEQR